MDVTFEGELLRLRVAEHASLPEAHLWWHKQEPGFLLKKLREGIAGLTDAGLAGLAVRRARGQAAERAGAGAGLEGKRAGERLPRLPRQGAVPGVGLPGTGKTRVLRSAIGDLLAADKRVLLVSGTNIAVDNALHETLKERQFAPGEIVRVGPPQLPEIANDPRVSLPLMVRDLLAEVEQERRSAAGDLREMNDRKERLEALQSQLVGFDPAGYDSAVVLLGRPGQSVAELSAALDRCAEAASQEVSALDSARATRDTALADVTAARPVRDYWTAIDGLAAEQAEVERDATRAEARALKANNAALDAQDAVATLTEPNGRVRRRNRAAHAAAQQDLNEKLRALDGLRAAADEARGIADATRRDTGREIARLAAGAPLSREEIQRRDDDAALAEERVRALERARHALLAERDRLSGALNAASAARGLVAHCDQRGGPCCTPRPVNCAARPRGTPREGAACRSTTTSSRTSTRRWRRTRAARSSPPPAWSRPRWPGSASSNRCTTAPTTWC